MTFSSDDVRETAEWPAGLLAGAGRRWVMETFSVAQRAFAEAIGTALLVFWALGLAFKVAAGAIHILLVIALVLFIVNLVSGRRTTI